MYANIQGWKILIDVSYGQIKYKFFLRRNYIERLIEIENHSKMGSNWNVKLMILHHENLRFSKCPKKRTRQSGDFNANFQKNR